MGECGCRSNDDRYILPAPNDAIYVITLSGHCTNCDGGTGITIERIDKNNLMYEDYKNGDYVRGELPLMEWAEGLHGIGIITGHRRQEFIQAGLKHLIGVSSDDMGEHGRIDEVGADVILEEMYNDVQKQPELAI